MCAREYIENTFLLLFFFSFFLLILLFLLLSPGRGTTNGRGFSLADTTYPFTRSHAKVNLYQWLVATPKLSSDGSTLTLTAAAPAGTNTSLLARGSRCVDV